MKPIIQINPNETCSDIYGVISKLESEGYIVIITRSSSAVTVIHDEMLNDIINRRVEIERELFAMWKGEKPLPDKDKCRALAMRLGTPKDQLSDKFK